MVACIQRVHVPMVILGVVVVVLAVLYPWHVHMVVQLILLQQVIVRQYVIVVIHWMILVME